VRRSSLAASYSSEEYLGWWVAGLPGCRVCRVAGVAGLLLGCCRVGLPGCRGPGLKFRLASTASRSCTQRADEAPAFAADRSLSGRSQLRCAHGLQIWACFARSPRIVQLVSALLRRAARSSPVVNGRTERRPIEAVSSRRRWALGPSGWIAAGVPRLPLSGALGVEHPRVSARRRFSQSSREVAGNKYRSAAYLLKLRYRIISNTYGSGTTY